MDESGARVIARIAAGVPVAATAAHAADDKTVLTIYAETRLLPVMAILDQQIRSTLQSQSAAPIRFHTEYLDLSWFAGNEAEDLIARLMTSSSGQLLSSRLRLLAEIFAIVLLRRRAHTAEKKVEQGREDLAHALRVATLGELGATLAHEINQPLTAIVSNAQAIRLTLDSAELNRREVAEALHDIAEDAQRASEVIRRLRALFRKDRSGQRPLDVNEAIVEVTKLLKKDLERNEVALQLDLAKELPRVLGDTVQLQQVFLNVMVNACEAMNGADGVPRRLRIETAQPEPGKVTIAVRDSGKGVRDGDLSHIFDRFVTTKPEGLGMGLSISRSIIEAHGGRIWATRNQDRGLTIHSELPSLPA